MRRSLLIICGVAIPFGSLMTWFAYTSSGDLMRGDLGFTIVSLVLAWSIPIGLGAGIAFAVNKALRSTATAGPQTALPTPRQMPKTVAGKLWRVTWVSTLASAACYIVLSGGPIHSDVPYHPAGWRVRLLTSAELGGACFTLFSILIFVRPLLASKPNLSEASDPPSPSELTWLATISQPSFAIALRRLEPVRGTQSALRRAKGGRPSLPRHRCLGRYVIPCTRQIG